VALYFESDISGAGQSALVGGVRVQTVGVRVITVGPSVRSVDWPAVTDHFLRLGWFAIGNNVITESDGIQRLYWRPPQHINWVLNYFSFESQFPADTTSNIRGSHIRWCLATGTTAHIVVNGV